MDTQRYILAINQHTISLIQRLGELNERRHTGTSTDEKIMEEVLIEKQLEKMKILDDEGCFIDCWLSKEIDTIWEKYM